MSRQLRRYRERQNEKRSRGRAPIVRGSGGKGSGSGRVAKEDPDSLTSRQLAKLIEALSEGEIAGFADPDHPLQCVALEGTPIENPDGSLNFKNFDFFFLPGTQDQSYLPGYEAAASITPENVKVTTSVPWTKRFTNTSLDAVRIDVRFPRLQKQNTTNGDITGTSVQLRVSIKQAADEIGAVYVTKITDTIKGKASNPYVRSYRLDLAGLTAPWDIRVERLSPDHDETQAIQDDIYIESYSEVVYGKLRYPNTAVVGISVDAEQFGTSIPSRAYRMKGMIIRVPLNYDPIARTYAETGPGTDGGTWNGEWKLAWTNNPAWCYYDMATHKRYGLGTFLSDVQVNKFALYQIAKYSDGWNARPDNPDDNYGPTGKHGVPDGKGGFEPRFMCNLYLQKREDAMKVLTDMATIFRGMHYFAEGVLQPIQDRPREADIQFGPANVINGVFKYSGTARKARHTAALVSYNDQNNFSKLTPEPFEDGDAILRYGYNPLFITNIGTTSQMCARRAGKWALTAERILTDTISFQVGAEGFQCRPGRVAQITDPLRDGAEWSGRIKAVTATTLTLDFEVELLTDDFPYWLYFTVFDEAEADPEKRSKTVAVLVTNAAGVTDTLTFATQPLLPDVETLWQIGSANRTPELFQILGATPRDNATVDVVALQYKASLYEHIDDDVPLDEPLASPIPSPLTVIPIKSKTFADGISHAGSKTFESPVDRFDKSWEGHRITATGITGAIVVSVEGPRSLTLSENATTEATDLEYEFSAIGVRQVALNDNVQGVSRDLHIGWLASEDKFVRGYRVAFRMEDGNWKTLPENGGTDTIIESVIPGIYEVAIVVVNRFGKTSTAVGLDIDVDIINPLEGATVDGLEIVGQGSVTDYATPDVQFGWRITSPAMAAQGLGGDDSRFDPFFEAFLVTIYNADTMAVIQPTVTVTQPNYTFTLEKNKAAAIAIGAAGPFPRYKIGVRILDRFKNESDEAYLPVNKLAPATPLAPFNLVPTISGINVAWTNPVDPSRARIDIYMDGSDPSFKIASTSGSSTQKAIDGITGNSYRFFLIKAVDVYGLESGFLELGWAKPGTVNNIAEVQFIPDGGAVNFLGSGVSNVHLAHVDPAAEIWFRVNDATRPTNNPADSIKYFDGLLAINPPDTAATFTAAAFVNGLWGPVTTRAFTLNPSGGGGGTTDAAVAPVFDPTPGAYEEETGVADIAFGTPAADAIFYTKTTNGSDPADPTHDGSGNPTGTTIKVAGDSVSLTLGIGATKFKAIAAKAGLDDSTIATATYQIIKTIGVPL